ncbi:hypothetical protein JR316_0005610 [Psilocybe cubensis]|uniref:Uncharacterized protein n=2 Tax=Psilocybe cubensis TaxID=181762 RepID=A0ACB8H0S6_PSICU|nr:hypothetical protein JR316_0005610 [Psilocybe cubensis]KAH9481091.1 hypothetical protein JR316_0005610 [Psilocybe cubensis]
MSLYATAIVVSVHLLLGVLNVMAQSTGPWYFPDRLTLANGQGNSDPTRPVSFLNDTLWRAFDLNKPFNLTARLSVSDQRFWRAAISIESPQATSALFRIALPPNDMRFNLAWMSGPQTRGGAFNTTASAPALNTEFDFALVKNDSSISISINGERQWSTPFSSQIFNAPNKSIILGRTMLDGNALRSQWNGVIRNVLLSQTPPSAEIDALAWILCSTASCVMDLQTGSSNFYLTTAQLHQVCACHYGRLHQPFQRINIHIHAAQRSMSLKGSSLNKDPTKLTMEPQEPQVHQALASTTVQMAPKSIKMVTQGHSEKRPSSGYEIPTASSSGKLPISTFDNTTSPPKTNHSTSPNPITPPQSSKLIDHTVMHSLRDTTSPIICAFFVIIGSGLMVAGTLVVRHFFLPHIYTCPDGATCHDNFDPKGNIIPRLQTLMQYWFQAGVFIASLGLSELISCNARLVLKKRTDVTILAVERGVNASKGKMKDAALQLSIVESLYSIVSRLWRRGDYISPKIHHGTGWLGVLALSQVAVGIFISFIVGFSIPDLQSTTTVKVPFSYRSIITLPRADRRYPSIDERVVGGVLDNWLILPNSAHRSPTAFDGSLAVQDNRTILAINPQASGSHITGGLSCGRQGWNVSNIPFDSDYFSDDHAALPSGSKAYNISGKDSWVVTYSYFPLAASPVLFPNPNSILISNSTINRQYVWAGNTSKVIPNATASEDGGIFFTVCNQTVFMDDLPEISEVNTQAINPSLPVIFSDTNDPFTLPCISSDPFTCVAWSVDRIISSWWLVNAVFSDLIPFSCVEGMLVAYDGLSDTNNCALNSERWHKTLNMTLSALISAAPLSGNLTQNLSVTTEAMNTHFWLIQLVLPGATMTLLLACLSYMWCLIRKGDVLYKLDLPEVVANQKKLEVNEGNTRTTTVTVE